MKRIAIFLSLVLLVVWIGVAQDDTAVNPAVVGEAEVQEDARVDDAQPTSPLDQLDWMVGQWIDRGDEATVVTNCSWTRNRSFLSRTFRVTINEDVTLEGTQVVGWDPVENRIRSWTFDSDGGFGKGRWIQDGNRWLVKTSYVLASGERASALNIFTYVDQDTFRWRSIGREIAGELQPSIPEVTVVRQQVNEDESQPIEKEVSQ
jgi:hypothetical protein